MQDDEIFRLLKTELFTAVVGDVMDALGFRHQYLPPGLAPLRQDMVIAGRAMPVLDDTPAADLAGTSILVLAGEDDVIYGPYAPALVALLRGHGAQVEAHTVQLGHDFGAPDEALIRRWCTAPHA